MTDNNNSKKGSLVQVGAGWTKEGKDGNDFISGTVDRNFKIFVENKDGERAEVDNLFVFFSDKTDKEGRVNPKLPDVRICANLKS